MMNIAICIKAVRADLVYHNSFDRELFAINPYDLHTLNEIVKLKNQFNCTIDCICMGPNQIKNVLIKCLAIGADNVYWLKDSIFAGSDTVATSYIISEALKKIKYYNLIICGEKSVDGETGQIGVGISERLNIPFITDVIKILELYNDFAIIKTENLRFNETYKVEFPVLLVFKSFSTISNHLSLLSLKKAQKKEIYSLKACDLDLQENRCGIKGSKTKVLDMIPELISRDNICIDGTPKQISERIIDILYSKRIGKLYDR